MNIEIGIAIGVVIAFGYWTARIWHQSHHAKHEFFHFERHRHIRRLRIVATGALGAAAFAVLGLTGWNAMLRADQQRQQQLIRDLRGEMIALRTDRARAAELAAFSETSATAPEETAVDDERFGVVLVPRAKVRAGPAGPPQFELTEGARVRLLGAPAAAGGRLWQFIGDGSGRRGWIAQELLRS